MFCEKCGNQLVDGSRFCGKCGASFTNTDNSIPTGYPQYFPAQAVKQGKVGAVSICSLILCIVSILAIVLAIFFMSNPDRFNDTIRNFSNYGKIDYGQTRSKIAFAVVVAIIFAVSSFITSCFYKKNGEAKGLAITARVLSILCAFGALLCLSW